MREIIKTNDGYMVQLPSGDYLHDADGDNLFDTFVEASALAYGLPKPDQRTINWGKANAAFYAWEDACYGDDSPLSDNDRDLWIHGYFQALRDAK